MREWLHLSPFRLIWLTSSCCYYVRDSSWALGSIMAKEVLSPVEERFERWRRGIGLFAGPVVFILIYLIPIPSLSKEAHILAAVFGLVLIFCLSEGLPIPVTAILGAILNVVLGIAPAK